MKSMITSSVIALSTLTITSSILTAQAPAAVNPEAPYLSLRLEMENAIKTGNQYLKSVQNEQGFWKDDTIPAYTALAITAAMRAPDLAASNTPAHIKPAYKWLLSTQHETGAVYVKGLATYNTATSIMALAASGDPAHKDPILKARAFLISQQADYSTNQAMNKYHGGIGYGGSHPHSDMSNTYLSIEAIKISEVYAKDSEVEKQPELDWDRALQFISRCQNLEATNDQPGIGNDGSMVYFPGNSKTENIENPDGTTTLRGYGSISYAGLLSMVYADLGKDDPRVAAVTDWLNNNYTVKENPGMGLQGLYYYFNVMAKALTAANIDTITTKDGKKIDWRQELAKTLLTAQREDGSWVNKNSRWWENQPELVTCYAVLTLEQIHASIPKK
ncbi:MAG: prenyltransferase/squalene oxidase repeat-containing protein [Akkermansiaceae bacterium]